MSKRKVGFRDFSPDNKVMLSFFYGALALMTVMTAYTFKYDREGHRLFLIGTGIMSGGAITSHVLAKKEACGRLHEAKERN